MGPRRGLTPSHHLCGQERSIACIAGWHRWQVMAEEDMQVRTCTQCGRRRYHGPLPGKDKAAAPSWGFNYTGGGGLGGDGA